jgi:putative transcriptional regulator
MNQARFLSGQLLLAMPGIGDSRFERAVIAMCSHDEAGALGIGIGHHAMGLGLHGVLRQFDLPVSHIDDAPILLGGPVEPKRGFVLHSLDWGGQGTIDVAGRWGLSGTIDALRVLGTPSGPSRWLVALGYAGWGAGQLDGELHRHGWHIGDGDTTIIFDLDAKDRWEAAFEAQGIDSRLLAHQSGTA